MPNQWPDSLKSKTDRDKEQRDKEQAKIDAKKASDRFKRTILYRVLLGALVFTLLMIVVQKIRGKPFVEYQGPPVGTYGR